ncbi:MAG: hypothetical protein ACLU0O_04120 [Collinsella sp.]
MTMAKFLLRWALPLGVFGVNAQDSVQGRQVHPWGMFELRMFPLDFEEFCWAIG